MREYCFNDDMTGFVECHHDIIIEESVDDIIEIFIDNYMNDMCIDSYQNETHTIIRNIIFINDNVVFIVEEHTNVIEYEEEDEDIFNICVMKYGEDIYYVETLDELKKLIEGVLTGWFS